MKLGGVIDHQGVGRHSYLQGSGCTGLVSKGRRMWRDSVFNCWAMDGMWVHLEEEKEGEIAVFFAAIVMMQRWLVEIILRMDKGGL